MQITVTANQWLKQRLKPELDSFRSACRDVQRGRCDDGEKVLIDCMGVTIGHTLHDALIRSGEDFGSRNLRRLAVQLTRLEDVASKAGLSHAPSAIGNIRKGVLDYADWHEARELYASGKLASLPPRPRDPITGVQR